MSPPTQTAVKPNAQWNGVTTPSRRGGSGRPLTEAPVELGFAGGDPADAAVAASRRARAPSRRGAPAS